MEMWETVKTQAELLKEYSGRHCYTDWEATHLDQIYQDLLGVSTLMEDKFKQYKRSTGGMDNKIRSLQETIEKLEDRLEELESEIAEAKGR